MTGRTGGSTESTPRGVDIEVVDTAIRATDRMGDSTAVEAVGWDETDQGYEFPPTTDHVISGRTTELSLPAVIPELTEIDDDGELVNRRQVTAEEPYDLPGKRYALRVETPVIVDIHFDGPATLEAEEGGDLVLSFDHPEVVSLGFRSRLRYPRQTITIAPTTEGLATGIAHLSVALETTGPTRSANPERNHPPRLEVGDETDVPEGIARHVPDTGLTLRLPDRRRLLFPAAPLAYYLAANVEIDPGASPVLRSEDGTVECRLGEPPEFQYRVNELLRRVFLLDSLTRYVAISGASPGDLDLVSLLDADLAATVESTDVERLRTYLDVDFERISSALPEWHYVTYVEPSMENAAALPYLLRYLSAVYTPDAAPGRAGDDHARFQRVPETVPRRVVEDEVHGSTLAWMAPEPPPDDRPFAVSTDAYEHTPRYLDRTGNAGRVVVACADPSRRDVRDDAVDLYREYGPSSMQVEAHEDVTRADLADLFDRGADFLHFVGPCSDGFACSDGTLDPAALDRSDVRLFFLDGPRSRRTGIECIRQGSTGGFVRDGSDDRLDPDTRRQILGLTTRGFTLEGAWRYATGVGDGRDDVVAVGNCVQQLIRTMNLYCVPATVEPVDVNRFEVTAYPYIPEAGFIWHSGLPDRKPRLCANPFRLSVTGPELEYLIDEENVVPVVDDVVHWDPKRDFFYPFV